MARGQLPSQILAKLKTNPSTFKGLELIIPPPPSYGPELCTWKLRKRAAAELDPKWLICVVDGCGKCSQR